MENITQVIRQRFSCRTFSNTPLPKKAIDELNHFIDQLPVGPFNSGARFRLLASQEVSNEELRHLGTYGFIQGATAFIVGATSESDNNLEDFGYLMEMIILFATGLGLGTCWLGGSFTRGTFAQKINSQIGEIIPAVSPVGEMISRSAAREGLLRKRINADQRLEWSRLFFQDDLSTPLSEQDAGIFLESLEMVRIGPSASNKQPWRVVKQGENFHFYLRRTKGYHEGILQRFLGVVDLQRIDMGIAMCHFQLTNENNGINGEFECDQPDIVIEDELTQYITTWSPK